ncbi:unnamed protein product, partial [Coffea canephora]
AENWLSKKAKCLGQDALRWRHLSPPPPFFFSLSFPCYSSHQFRSDLAEFILRIGTKLDFVFQIRNLSWNMTIDHWEKTKITICPLVFGIWYVTILYFFVVFLSSQELSSTRSADIIRIPSRVDPPVNRVGISISVDHHLLPSQFNKNYFLGVQVSTFRPSIHVHKYYKSFLRHEPSSNQKWGRHIQQFLGVVNYVREFIPKALKHISPLTKMLKKDPPPWGKSQTTARYIFQENRCIPPEIWPGPYGSWNYQNTHPYWTQIRKAKKEWTDKMNSSEFQDSQMPDNFTQQPESSHTERSIPKY